MLNYKQAPEKRVPSSVVDTLDVHSVFLTIQGEGPFAGRRAVFVRLAGCNLQCPGCDTDYTTGRTRWSVAPLVRRVCELLPPTPFGPRELVVITGGEPFRQAIIPLIRALAVERYHVQIETNGTLGVNSQDFASLLSLVHLDQLAIICSPKTGNIAPSIRDLVYINGAYKYVLRGDEVAEDGLPTRALGHPAQPRLARPSPGVPVYLQPMDEQDEVLNKINMDAVTKMCLKHGYLLSLQTHKIIGVE